MTKSELMGKILARPPLYLGHQNVISLEMFITGYAFGFGIDGVDARDPVYDGFHDWLVNRFGFGHSHSWSSIVQFMGQSEAKAFELTKKLWAEYTAST